MDFGFPDRAPAFALAPRALRQGRSRSARWRRARRLSGRGLPGAARGRAGAGLGGRRVDWRRQRRDHRRKSAGAAAGTATRVLGDDHRPPDLAMGSGRRRSAEAVERLVGLADHGLGQPGFFTPNIPQSLVQLSRRQNRDQLSRQRAAQGDAAASRGFRSAEQRSDPLRRRSGECIERQLRLFRQCQRARSGPST